MIKVLVKRALASLGYTVNGIRQQPRHLLDSANLRTLEFDDVVCRRMFEVGPRLTFVQIGAFDGTTADPLRKYIERCAWRGVLVEPQSRAAEKLRHLYRGSEHVVVMQAAVDASVGKRVLFTAASDAVPAWVGGLASFTRDAIAKHRDIVPQIDALIAEEVVDCVPFDAVLDRLPSETLDLLQIDAEGADAYLLSLFPFDRVRPAIIHWEVKHLTKSAREECFDRLVHLGYRLAVSGSEDMIAVLERP